MAIRRRPTARSAHDSTMRLIDGWPVERLIDLECQADRRLIGPLMAASAARRSAVFSALAALDSGAEHHPHLDGMTPQRLAEWLLAAPPREIVRQVWGDNEHLVSTMIKTAGAPLNNPDHYARLAAMMTNLSPRGMRQQQCLLQAATITSDLILTVDILRDAFLRPTIVDGIAQSGIGQRIEAVSKFLLCTCPKLSEHALAQSLEGHRDESIQEWATRMLLRHARVICDLADDDDFLFLRSGDDFRRYAREYKNCLSAPDMGKITNASLGVSAYAAYRHAPIIVELMRAHDGRDEVWLCEGIHAPENGFVPDELEDEVRAKLRCRAIVSLSICARHEIDPDVVAQIWFEDPFQHLPLRSTRRRNR